MIPSSSRDDNTRRQRQDLLGHRLQSQGIPSNKFGESPIKGNKGTSKSLTKPPDERTTEKPGNKSGDPQRIRAVKYEQLARTTDFEETPRVNTS